MGIDPFTLHKPEMAKCLTAPERKARNILTPEEAIVKHAARLEKDLQQQIAQYLRLLGIWFDQDAMHKRRTGAKGTPDFLFAYRPRHDLTWDGVPRQKLQAVPIAIEVKTATGKVNEAQRDCHRAMIADGWYVLIARSLADVQELLRAIDKPNL